MDNTKDTGSSPVRVLPSEWAQQLAAFLIAEYDIKTNLGFDYLEVTPDQLARRVQEYYDSIP